MKVVSDYTFRKDGKEIPPGKEFELSEAEAKDRISRGLCRDVEAERKAKEKAIAEAEAAANGEPVGGKKGAKGGGSKSSD